MGYYVVMGIGLILAGYGAYSAVIKLEDIIEDLAYRQQIKHLLKQNKKEKKEDGE